MKLLNSILLFALALSLGCSPLKNMNILGRDLMMMSKNYWYWKTIKNVMIIICLWEVQVFAGGIISLKTCIPSGP